MLITLLIKILRKQVSYNTIKNIVICKQKCSFCRTQLFFLLAQTRGATNLKAVLKLKKTGKEIIY